MDSHDQRYPELIAANIARAEVAEYLPVKRRMISAGLLSCSQQGFNLAIGPLAELRCRLMDWVLALLPGAERWEVPPLIRSDWVERGVWDDPPESEWCREEPGANLLTPRPLMHLANRLRHHPVDFGQWVLNGVAVRHEDPEATLPLLRQRAFMVQELAAVSTKPEKLQGWGAGVMARMWEQALAWNLPVELRGAPGPPEEAALFLRLPAEQPLLLARSGSLRPEVLAAYGLTGQQFNYATFGPERWTLALMARHGVDPGGWPPLRS